MKFLIIISALVLSCLVHDSMALQCYTCTACGSSFGTVTNCSSIYTSCSKTVASAFGFSAVSKSCSTGCTEAGASLMGVSGGSFCCSTDLCNFSSKVTSSFYVIIASAFALLFFKK
ncbi:unnamed protein product [Brachionus calyciflorus]|uniref:Snake toxin/toxin-like domain-containing protein n=1 Tax=Brachionus calyciflorus TaxID=104777 RepID=A0A814HKF3_9BILA|nr:unnamed protein product [Brachionus calyciflorus]